MKAWWMGLVSLNLVALFFGLRAPQWGAVAPCTAQEASTNPPASLEASTAPPAPSSLVASPLANVVAASPVEASTPAPASTSSTETVEVTVLPTVEKWTAVAKQSVELAVESERSRLRCHFRVDPCVDLTLAAAATFDNIYARNTWGSRAGELGTHTRSGLGSDMKGAFDWIVGLSKFFIEHPELQTIADIPSGDMGWQMAVRHLNTAKLYFGGDIAKSVALDNAKRYSKHENKILQHWDLYSCGAPHWYTSCNATKNNFDVIMIRDALQHISINKVQEILRKVILNSGAKWFITSVYPGGDPNACKNENIACKKGAMGKGDGGWFPVALDCAPFNFPAPSWKTASHKTFPIENDYMYVYRIDQALKDAVMKMKLCPADIQNAYSMGSSHTAAFRPAVPSSRFRYPGQNR